MPLVHLPDHDEPVEIEASAVEWTEGEKPEGFFSADDMQKEVKRRADKAYLTGRDEAKKELAEDNEFFREIAEARGIPFDEEGNPKLGEEIDVEQVKQQVMRDQLDQLKKKIRKEIEVEQVEPLKKTLESNTETLDRLKRKTLYGDILQAAQQADVRKTYLTPPFEGGPTPVISMFRDVFGWDNEHEMWAQKSEDGEFIYSADAPEGRPYAGAEEFFKQLKSNDAYRYLFEDNRPGNTGLGETGGARSPYEVSVEDFQSGKLTAEQVDKIAKGEIKVRIP